MNDENEHEVSKVSKTSEAWKTFEPSDVPNLLLQFHIGRSQMKKKWNIVTSLRGQSTKPFRKLTLLSSRMVAAITLYDTDRID